MGVDLHGGLGARVAQISGESGNCHPGSNRFDVIDTELVVPEDWGINVTELSLSGGQVFPCYAIYQMPGGSTGLKMVVSGWAMLEKQQVEIKLGDLDNIKNMTGAKLALRDTTQEPEESSASTQPDTSTKSEYDLISELADKHMGKVTTYSCVDCGLDEARPGSKTVNVIAETTSKDSFTSDAGQFMEQVFGQYPDVYYIQMKGLENGMPSIQFAMSRAESAGLSPSDWYSEYIMHVRDYWDDEQ